MTTAPHPARRLASAVLLLAVATGPLAGCSEGDAEEAVDQAREAASSAIDDVDLPDVDWGAFGDRLKDRIDEAAEKADCDALADAVTRYEGQSNDLTDYIEAKLREADC